MLVASRRPDLNNPRLVESQMQTQLDAIKAKNVITTLGSPSQMLFICALGGITGILPNEMVRTACAILGCSDAIIPGMIWHYGRCLDHSKMVPDSSVTKQMRVPTCSQS